MLSIAWTIMELLLFKGLLQALEQPWVWIFIIGFVIACLIGCIRGVER